MGKSILVITEEPITRYLLRLILERDGHEVFEADYGLEALSQVRSNKLDVLIMDVARRNKDGFVVCCPNGDEKPTALLPALMLNAKTQFDVLKQVLSANITNYLPKPVMSQDLIESVRSALSGSAFGPHSELQPA
ncbi:MAG: response regulator [Chloroflexi bacterium]|nr:response regulator [Chloroflexota bacterium]